MHKLWKIRRCDISLHTPGFRDVCTSPFLKNAINPTNLLLEKQELVTKLTLEPPLVSRERRNYKCIHNEHRGNIKCKNFSVKAIDSVLHL